MRNIIFVMLLLITSISATTSAQESLLLSGFIKAENNQAFFAPKTDNWRVQIKWMVPEGETVKAGELAVLFDSGSIDSKIEQEEISLLAAEEELHRLVKTGGQEILKAEYEMNRAELSLQKAKVEANIAHEHIIEFEYQRYQVALEKALVTLVKAQGKYKQAKLSDSVARTKQALTITRHKDSLKYQQYKLSKMALYAQKSGPILYNDYWGGEKIYVGMTVQTATKVAQIPALSMLYIEAWLHEIDYNKIRKNQTATLTFDAFPKQQLNAQLTELSTQPEKKKNWGSDVYFKAKFSFLSPSSLKLLPGMSAQLELDNNVVNSSSTSTLGESSE